MTFLLLGIQVSWDISSVGCMDAALLKHYRQSFACVCAHARDLCRSTMTPTITYLPGIPIDASLFKCHPWSFVCVCAHTSGRGRAHAPTIICSSHNKTNTTISTMLPHSHPNVAALNVLFSSFVHTCIFLCSPHNKTNTTISRILPH